MKNFIQDGKTIEYKVAETAIKSGDVRVIGDVAGVAVTDGAVDETVVLNVTGVYELAKGTGAITQGQRCMLLPTVPVLWQRPRITRLSDALGRLPTQAIPRCWSS